MSKETNWRDWTHESDTPKFVYETVETDFVPDPAKAWMSAIKKVFWIIVAIIIVGSLLFGENLLGELSMLSLAILFGLAVSFGFKNTDKEVPIPMSIKFYEDCFVIYRDHVYYSKKSIRREYNLFKFNDVEKIKYNILTKHLSVVGKIDATWFNYNKDGSLPDEPFYHRVVDGGICHFCVNGDDEEKILSLLEEHTGKQMIRYGLHGVQGDD